MTNYDLMPALERFPAYTPPPWTPRPMTPRVSHPVNPTTAMQEYTETPLAQHIARCFKLMTAAWRQDVDQLNKKIIALGSQLNQTTTALTTQKRTMWHPPVRPQAVAVTPPLLCHVAVLTDGSVYVQLAFHLVQVVQVVGNTPVPIPAPILQKKRRMGEVELLQRNAQSMGAIKKQR